MNGTASRCGFTASFSAGVIAALLVAVVAGPLAAQNILHQSSGVFPGDRYGWQVDGLSDLDGDGHDEFIVGIYHADDPLGASTGAALVFSGADRTLMYELYNDGPSLFGMAVSRLGDVDQDGTDDFAVGIPTVDGPNPGRVRVFSGATGDELLTLTDAPPAKRFGYELADAGDCNDDGWPDLAVGAPEDDTLLNNGGRAYVFSGEWIATTAAGGTPASSRVLQLWEGTSLEGQLGFSVAGAGDVDDDGHDDVIVGAPLDIGGGDFAGTAFVFSGLDGTVLHAFSGTAFAQGMGASVDGGGDVDGDGVPDVAVGAYGWDAGASTITDEGAAFVFSGDDGSLLHQFAGDDVDDMLGWSVALPGDLDNDGRCDVVAGAPGDDDGGSDAGAIRAWSGASGVELYTLHGAEANDHFGHFVRGAGDTDGDCIDDVIVGSYFDDGVSVGFATVVSPIEAVWADLDASLSGGGAGGSGEPPCLSVHSTLLPGAPIALRMTGGLSASPAFLMLGFSALNLPLMGGLAVPDFQPPGQIIPLVLDGEGRLHLAATWPATVPSGLELYLQVWTEDAGGPFGLAASNAVVGTVP